MSITLTFLIAAGTALFLKNQVKPWLGDLSKQIDEWTNSNDDEYDQFRSEVFDTMRQLKHTLGKDGFEKLT